MGYRTIIARYVAKWGIAQMCLCDIKYRGGVSHHFGGVLTSLRKYRAIWGIAAIVMGPLSCELGQWRFGIGHDPMCSDIGQSGLAQPLKTICKRLRA